MQARKTEPRSQLFELKQETGAHWGCTSLIVLLRFVPRSPATSPPSEGGDQDEDSGLQREELDTAAECGGAWLTSSSQGMLTQSSARL